MRYFIRHSFLLSVLLLYASGAWAGSDVRIITQKEGVESTDGGQVTAQVSEGICMLTASPAMGYLITIDDIKVTKMIAGNQAQARLQVPSLAEPIALSPVDVSNPAATTTYSFVMPDEAYDVEVVANFHPLGYETYPLWVGNIQVDEKNMANILNDEGDPTLYFDGDSILVFNNAVLENKPVISSLKKLKVYLQGESEISSAVTAVFANTLSTQDVPLIFTTNANDPGLLKASVYQGSLTSGFSVRYEHSLTSVETGENERTVMVPIEPVFINIEESNGETVSITFGPEDFQEGGEDVDLGNTLIKEMLLTLKNTQNTQGDGYDDGTLNGDDPGIVINSETNMEDLSGLDNYVPRTADYAEQFTGITIVVPAGTGDIRVRAYTEGAYALGIKIGNNDPTFFSGMKVGDICSVHYEVLEPTTVYIFNAGIQDEDDTADESRPQRGGKKSAIHVKVYGVDIDPDALIGVNSLSSMLGNGEEPVKVVSAQSASQGNGGINLNNVLGKPVTDLGNNVFEGMDMSQVSFVDLSQSNVQGLTGSRTVGPLAGVSPETLIFLPSGSADLSESNVIVDGVCKHLTLANNPEIPFASPYDFLVKKFDFNKLFKVNTPESFYLPIELTAAQAASLGTFHDYAGISGSTAVFNKAETGSIPAHTPFVFIPSSSTLSLSNVTVKSTTSLYEEEESDGARAQAPYADEQSFYGTYQKIDWTASLESVYQLKETMEGNRFVRLTEGQSIPAFSCYLLVSNGSETLDVLINDETGIDAATVFSNGTARASVFTLDGQRLAGTPTKKGIYIQRQADGKSRKAIIH